MRRPTLGSVLSALFHGTAAALVWGGTAMVLTGLTGCAFGLDIPGRPWPQAIAVSAGLAGAARALWKGFHAPPG